MQTFYFVDSPGGSTIGNNSMTDAINISVTEIKPPQVPPGMLYNFSVVLHDELGNVVQPLYFVQTSKPNILIADSTTLYTYDSRIRV